ncbi:MAG: LysM peptidoglycan-binding domain-containing protein [Methanophagales archaeon ANME-1-THS]|nr:MAG: LysM peptidoglycan-binding domain-containing protein [Methanophagales archaeon ANME-1-THS]
MVLVKAFLTRKDKPWLIVPFLFNPAEFTVERTNQFTEMNIPGLPSSIFQFVKGGARTITMDLFFDTYEEQLDVRLLTDRITGWDSGSMFSKLPDIAKGLMDIDSDLHAPPVCLFIWGTYIFPCVIERVSKRFTMFLPEGFPVRATLSVTLKEYREFEKQVIETSLQSADRTKRWTVRQGDTLWFIAAQEYGNPTLWRRIADANKIDNPRVLKPGMELVIPPLE